MVELIEQVESSRSALGEVAERWLRTCGARVALVILVLFYTVAIFAPLVANDRPYFLEAIDIGRYESARTSLAPVTRALAELCSGGEQKYLAQRSLTSRQSYAEAIANERSALRVRAETLRLALKTADEVLVDRFEAEVDAALSSTNTPPQRFESAIALAMQIGDDLVAIDTRTPGLGSAELESQRSRPLFAGLGAIDVFLMAFSVCALVALSQHVWLRHVFVSRESAERAHARRHARADRGETHEWRTRLVSALIVSTAITLAWRPLFGIDDSFANTSVKEGVRSGDLFVVRAVFPPISMGYAETNLTETFRPPTWTSSSKMNVEGGYARVNDTSLDHALQPRSREPRPVRVSEYEPALNSPWRHPLGTDSLGRDLLARLLWGARVSLFVGLSSAIVLTVIGTILGLLAGWFGGTIDFVISRAIEIVLCFPAFVLVLCALFFVDPRVVSPIVAVALVIAFVGWTGVARLVRAECVRLRELEFIAAARALGLSTPAILLRHVLPNALGPVIVAFAFAVGGGMLTESALSFLGFGVEAPIPSWGSLVGDSKTPDHWWIWLAPGLCIFAAVAAYNVAGDALRDALDPRRRVG